MPASQVESVHIAARLNGTYGSLVLYTTPQEKRRILERDAADAGNITGYAAYTSRAAEQDVILAQRLSVNMRYTSPTHLTTAEIHTIIKDQGTADFCAAEQCFRLARL